MYTVQSNAVQDVTLNEYCFNVLVQKYDATREGVYRLLWLCNSN